MNRAFSSRSHFIIWSHEFFQNSRKHTLISVIVMKWMLALSRVVYFSISLKLQSYKQITCHEELMSQIILILTFSKCFISSSYWFKISTILFLFFFFFCVCVTASRLIGSHNKCIIIIFSDKQYQETAKHRMV